MIFITGKFLQILNVSQHFRAAAVYNPPYVTHLMDGCSSVECFRGMYADVWHELAKIMNFTFTMSRQTAWGSLINGSWHGMIGEWVFVVLYKISIY